MNMYHIVIADDEQLERMVLQQALEEHLGSGCVIRTAANGREAVERALSIQADIVIMDIEMPGINGLEATGMLREKLPGCKVIILTAYSEFNYAKKAIELGASDYLLKPCADEELHAVIDRVAAKIDDERENTDRIRLLTTQIEEQLVLTVMGGSINTQYVLVNLRKLGLEFHCGVFAIAYAEPGTCDIESVTCAGKWPEHIHPITYLYDDKLYILCICSDSSVDCEAEAQKQLQRLSDEARALWGRPFRAALGSGFTHIEDAQQSCFQAQVTLSRCTDENPVVSFREQPESEDADGNPLVNCILIGDENMINEVIESLAGNLSAQRLDWAAIVERLETLVSRAVQKLWKGMEGPPPEISLSNGTEHDIDGLCRTTAEALLQISERISTEADARQGGRLAAVKKEIESFVGAHYHEDILLPVVAREMHYSSAHFSKLFKQCFQRNFIMYLTEARIAAAKDLMRGTDLTIREIGERVGYKDPNYFTKVFRKMTGKSPSAYKGAMAGKN